MRVLELIREWFSSVLIMSKESLNVRYSPAVLEEVKELINRGKYGSFADFMNRAAVELLHRELMEERIRKLVREEIEKSKNQSDSPDNWPD